MGASETIWEHSSSLAKLGVVHMRYIVSIASSDNSVDDAFINHFGTIKICSLSGLGFLIADIWVGEHISKIPLLLPPFKSSKMIWTSDEKVMDNLVFWVV